MMAAGHATQQLIEPDSHAATLLSFKKIARRLIRAFGAYTIGTFV
jgi:hypothetical protein